MAFTTEQLEKLDEALSQGVLKVKYADKEVTYQSTPDMLRLRNLMATELGLVDNSSGRVYTSFDKGFNK